jgi:hypothetical protein
MPVMRNSLSWLMLSLSLVAFAACLPMSSFCLRPPDCWTSWVVLVWGLFGLMVRQLSHFIWLANPGLLFTWIVTVSALVSGSQSSKIVAIGLGAFSSLLAASFLLGVSVIDNEGGVPIPVQSVEIGYWLWLGSIACAFAGAVLLPSSRTN